MLRLGYLQMHEYEQPEACNDPLFAEDPTYAEMMSCSVINFSVIIVVVFLKRNEQSPKMQIQKIHVPIPVIIRDIVRTRAYVVADDTGDRFVVAGHVRGVHTAGFQQAVDRFRMFGGQEFTTGVGPEVFFRAGHIDRPGGHQSDEHVLVHRQVTFPVIIVSEITAEPVRKSSVYVRYRLAVPSPRKRRPAGAPPLPS